MKHGARLAAVVVAGALALAACGGGSDGGSKGSKTTDSTMAQQPAATQTPAPNDVVATAIEAGDFTTLVKAVQAAGLVDTLKGSGPFTVFAPTDAAFAKLPPGTLDKLLANPMQLKQVLLYHVVAGRAVEAADVVKLPSVVTAEGKPITISSAGGTVTLNGTSKVLKPDVMASNGVIHVIDTVLIPPAQ